MKIVKVLKPLVSTNRIPGFEHKHLQVVQDGSSKAVAVDAVGAKPGDWVICVGSSAAREAAGSKEYPSDLTIVGIIDDWEEEA
jgi:carboxysome peptide A